MTSYYSNTNNNSYSNMNASAISPSAPAPPATSSVQHNPVVEHEKKNQAVPHPYRHNPYGEHQRVYYDQVEPVSVFQQQQQFAAPISTVSYTHDQSQSFNQYHMNNNQRLSHTTASEQMFSMHVPTEPGASYNPNAFMPAPVSKPLPPQQQQQQLHSSHHVSYPSNNSVRPTPVPPHHVQAAAAAPAMPMPIDERTSSNDSYNACSSEESLSNHGSSCSHSGKGGFVHHACGSNASNNSIEPLRFVATPPMGTLHFQALAGRMKFCLYPATAFELPEPRLPKHQMVRMFIGQLPYHVTEMQLTWLVYMFGGSSNIFHFERITKTDHSKGGVKVPTGCFHCHLEPDQVQPLLNFINDRLLVDDTGLWVADSEDEKSYLASYCHSMKVDRTKRFQGRPYGTVVAQVATSTFNPDTFVPKKRTTINNGPARRAGDHYTRRY